MNVTKFGEFIAGLFFFKGKSKSKFLFDNYLKYLKRADNILDTISESAQDDTI